METAGASPGRRRGVHSCLRIYACGPGARCVHICSWARNAAAGRRHKGLVQRVRRSAGAKTCALARVGPRSSSCTRSFSLVSACGSDAECKENANPQFRKSTFGSALQPTRLSFSASALKQHDRQARAGTGKPQPVKKPMKTVKEAGKQPLATSSIAPKKRILSERNTTVQGGDLKRSKIETGEQPPAQPSTAAADIDIADELADLFEEQDDVSDASAVQLGQILLVLSRAPCAACYVHPIPRKYADLDLAPGSVNKHCISTLL